MDPEHIDPARLEQLEKAFKKLQPSHQELILLARVKGLSYASLHAQDPQSEPPARLGRGHGVELEAGLAGVEP